ncbi:MULTISPECIES: CvfB family protein [unclassified Romboutsia]|uniref:CvfB family protein n=1 Tax=unclassified Romboutsia TaxID=2626894 RepID=UPI000820AA53|nr:MULTISPECIES: S1-like domain-containing RNA-binding protein [unclassified Romboutsia]SCH93527.1 Conserved virulence factor B [uncultured Clostridium sp.]
MIKIGDFNKLKVKRKADFGYFLDGKTNQTKDDILLHNRLLGKNSIEIGDEVEAFIFKDSEDRLSATLIAPKAKVGEISMLKVVAHTKIGSFIDIGLPKDILVPFKARTYDLEKGERYPFYIYVDKSERLAATTDIDSYLTTDHEYNIGDTVNGVVYGFQTNNSAMVVVDNKYAGVILHNEYFTELKHGQELTLKVIKIYEDGKLGLSPRQGRKDELDTLESSIISYLEGNDGFMRFNDKSTPEEIATVFNSSKKNFKRALGILMKKGVITQDSKGTYIK